MHYIVALTGGIGSGKSMVANAFAALGVPLVDADIIARQIVQPGSIILGDIVDHFGPTLLHADGSLDRAALRELVFRIPSEKYWLNSLLHPLIKQQTDKLICSIKAPYILWVVPLLIENNLQQHANRVLVVDVEPSIQIIRTMIRDRVNYHQVKNIMAAQVSRQQRLAYADDIINNKGRPKDLTDHVVTLHYRYLTLASYFRKLSLM